MFLQVLSMDVTEKWYSLVDAISLWVLALVAAGIWMSTARHDTAKQGRDTKKE
jgi:hypothetical protein